MSQTLTDLSLRTAKLPSVGTAVLWDATVKGLCVRISSGGTKAFSLVHGKERNRLALGRYPTISLAQARDAAKTYLAKKTLGQTDTGSFTFAEAKSVYIDHIADLRPKSRNEYKRILDKHFGPLTGKKLADIRAQDIAAILDTLSHYPAVRRYAFSVIRRLFRWCVGRNYLKSSPLNGFEAPKLPKSRTRVLSDDELKKIWHAAGEGVFGAIVRLCVLLGQRRTETALIRPEWIGEDTITFPSTITKNHREHTIPLPDCARPYLSRLKAFQQWSPAKRMLDKKSGVTGWTLHDLRRTFATNLAALGVPIHVTEKLLNHTSGSISGVAAIYNRHAYMDEMREAVACWEKHLHKLLASA